MILRTLLGASLGAGLGFLYSRYVGCHTGACPLTSNPLVATVYGGFLGALVTRW
jgi:hypothetical protein